MKRLIAITTIVVLAGLLVGCTEARAEPINACIMIDGNSRMAGPMGIAPDSLLSGTDQGIEWFVIDTTWSPIDATSYVWAHPDERHPGYWVTTSMFLFGHTSNYDRIVAHPGCAYSHYEFPYEDGGVCWDWPTIRASIPRIKHSFATLFLRPSQEAEIGEGSEMFEAAIFEPPDYWDRWDGWEPPHRPRSYIPRGYTNRMQDEDQLRILIQGTGLWVNYGGIELVACATAWRENTPGDTSLYLCEGWGGEMLIASYTGTDPYAPFLGMKQLILGILPEDPAANVQIDVVLSFAFAEEWLAHLRGIPGVNVIAGAGAMERTMLCDDNGWTENIINMCINDEQIYSPQGSTPILESTYWPITMYFGLRSDGVLFCNEFDNSIPPDGRVMFDEGTFLMNGYHDRNEVSTVIWQDYTVHATCPDITPRCGEEIAPPPEDEWSMYPNPFNPMTSINFDLPRTADVKLRIYDVLGRKVATLVNGTTTAGSHTAIWNASDFSTGIYFARFEANGVIQTRKLLFLK